MLKLLIVDDEPFIVEGMAELFSKIPELSVYKAFKSSEALKILDETRVDIVLTDIEMPGINGLELLEIIYHKWPFCKVMILTAYSNFTYAKAAIENKVFRYLLKTDGEEMLECAMKECIATIKEQREEQLFLEEIREQAKREIPLQQNECLLRILTWIPKEQIPHELERHQIDLDSRQEIILTAVRIDEFPQGADFQEQFEIMLQVSAVISHYMTPKYKNKHVSFRDKNMVWMMQDLLNEKSVLYLKEMYEIVQEHCLTILGISVSIVYDEYIGWENIQKRFAELKLILKQMPMNKEKLVLADTQYYIKRESMKEVTTEYFLNRTRLVGKLKECIEDNKEDEFAKILEQLLKNMEEPHITIGQKLEVYHMLAQVMLSQYAICNLSEELFQMPEYFDFFYHYCDSSKMYICLNAMMNQISFLKKQKKIDNSIGLMDKINRYIEVNLQNELSLTKISETFHMNPVYLSRVYKQTSGENLSEYIAEKRLQLAKRMLREGKTKINKLALEVGYESPNYFNRIFKKQEGMTPQEYRENYGSIEKEVEKRQ